VTDIYAAVPSIEQSSGAQTSVVCEALEVSRSAYYAWRDRAQTIRESRDTRLAQQIQAIFWRHRRRYGARRIAAELADQGEICSPRKVAQLLVSQGLRAIRFRFVSMRVWVYFVVIPRLLPPIALAAACPNNSLRISGSTLASCSVVANR
jgi:hypothetical protein